MAKLHVVFVLVVLFFVVMLSGGLFGQDTPSTVWLPNQEVRLNDLPAITAASSSKSAVLAAALETILHDEDVCCGKDSALEDVITYAGVAAPVSLKDIGTKLQGRHLLSDGRAAVVSTKFVSKAEIGPGQIVMPLREQQAQIFEWKSHLYVLYGAVYDETRSSDGIVSYSIRKIFLLDPRYSDAQREVVFNRETDDLEKVEGILMVRATLQ